MYPPVNPKLRRPEDAARKTRKQTVEELVEREIQKRFAKALKKYEKANGVDLIDETIKMAFEADKDDIRHKAARMIFTILKEKNIQKTHIEIENKSEHEIKGPVIMLPELKIVK